LPALLDRQSLRSGMLISSDELVSVVHPPSASVRSSKLKREEKRSKAAPALAFGHSLVLGENIHGGKTTHITLSADQRMRHTYIIGASGTGKSTLLLNLIVQDIKNGEGVAVLDPHGDLIDQILEHIPEERFGDVVLLDPSDEAYPVGFNILSAHSELEKNLLASDLVAVFRRLSTSWGDQMTSILGNAILAFLESEVGGSLLDLRRFLVEADFRQRFLSTVRDSEIVYFWQKEYPLLSGNRQGPILTRLDTFLRPKLIRHMVSQKENRLDFGAIMNEGKIFLAKLSQGAIGEENAYLLGTLLVSKLHQLAMSRQEMKEKKRRSFFLYIDEFQNFVTPSMASILSSVRKYRLGLTLAHQELRQLLSRDDDVTSAVLSNPYTRICFRLGDFDAKKLEDGFSFFEARDLQNLGIGEAICRVERAEYDFNLRTLPRPEEESAEAEQRRERIIQLSRQRYATKRETVEVEMRRDVGVSVPPPPPIPEPIIEKTAGPMAEKSSPPRAEPRAEAKEKVKTVPKAPATLGRGGQQHKYLQHLIKKIGEDKGYRAVIEKQVLGGLGSVDLALERDGQTIAIEISVTSTADQEVANIEKCLQAGFGRVVLVCSERKFLTKAEGLITARVQPEDLARIQFICPEEISHSLMGLLPRH
jgi:Type IV secretion-system coupling protein DNA-binding domain